MPTGRVSTALRRVVQARAEERCEYCRAPESFTTQSFAIDHIVPRSAGGPTTLDNLAWACFGCNSHKHATVDAADLQTGDRVRLFHPRRDAWNDHFEWQERGIRIAGKTAIGRTTIEALRLNRSGLVNLRGVLSMTGFHPPE